MLMSANWTANLRGTATAVKVLVFDPVLVMLTEPADEMRDRVSGPVIS